MTTHPWTTFVNFGTRTVAKSFTTRSLARIFAKQAKGNGTTGITTVVTRSNSKTAKRLGMKKAVTAQTTVVDTPKTVAQRGPLGPEGKSTVPQFVLSVVPPVTPRQKPKSRGKRAQLDLPLLALMA